MSIFQRSRGAAKQARGRSGGLRMKGTARIGGPGGPRMKGTARIGRSGGPRMKGTGQAVADRKRFGLKARRKGGAALEGRSPKKGGIAGVLGSLLGRR